VSHGDAEAIARSASVGMGIGLQSAGCSPCCLANQLALLAEKRPLARPWVEASGPVPLVSGQRIASTLE
jgi:hypothetical protein